MSLAGVALAAGEGRRLRPLTLLRPKPLCPVGARPLLDRALAILAPHTGAGPRLLAVNAHHLAEQVVAHVGQRAHVSVEHVSVQALGTAGALGHLAGWLDGRAVLLVNADTYLSGREPGAQTEPAAVLDSLVRGWDGERCRLLVALAGRSAPHRSSLRADFSDDRGDWGYLGACLLPGDVVAGLPSTPSGLYEVLWRDLDARGLLDLHPFDGVAIDCGTPADYLRANLHASGGASVVGAGAVVEGTVTRSVVWDGAFVGPDEHLVDEVRAGDRTHPVTVAGRLPR